MTNSNNNSSQGQQVNNLGKPGLNNPTSGQTLTWNGQNAQWITITIPSGGWIEDSEFEPKKKYSDGCTCKKCKELFPYAEPNQDDGSLICFACRHGY